MRDLELEAGLRVEDASEGSFTAGMTAFEAPAIHCERRQCAVNRECVVELRRLPGKA